MPAMLTRQESMLAVQQNQYPLQIVCTLCLTMSPAIAALVIASEYDEESNACAADNFTIDLVTFLNVAGGIGVGGGSLAICVACIAMVVDQEMAASFAKLLKGINSPMGFFLLIWAGYGLDMYIEQMSDACQEEDIGTMVFAWSVMMFCWVGLVCCCVCCAMCVSLLLATLLGDLLGGSLLGGLLGGGLLGLGHLLGGSLLGNLLGSSSTSTGHDKVVFCFPLAGAFLA